MREGTGRQSCNGERSTRFRVDLVLLVLLLATACAGLLRLWVVARPGSEEFAGPIHELNKATFGKIVDIRTPSEKLPVDQAAYWIDEVERVLEKHPEDAELHAACAMVLYEPSSIFVDTTFKEQVNAEPQFRVSELFDRLREHLDESDDAVEQRHLSLIRRATELAPNDPRWWRLRAIMCLESHLLTGSTNKVIAPDLADVLKSGAEHDPGNALYDLIAAQAVPKDFLDFNSGFIISDQTGWDTAFARLSACTNNRTIILGEPAAPGMVRLFEISTHPKATTVESIRGRLIDNHLAGILQLQG